MRCIDKLKILCNKSPSGIRKTIYFVYKNVSILPGILLREVIIEKLRENGAKCKTIEDHLELVSSFKFGPFDIRPRQVREEISQLAKILAELSPKKILEIGTANGGTLYLLTKVANPKATLISIDLPYGAFGGGYSVWKIPFYCSFGSKNQKIQLLRMDSHIGTALNKVKEILGGSELDFLFIDGDHSYEGVKKDFDVFSKLVKEGGIVAFHDIVRCPSEAKCQVNRFWLEIQKKYKHVEIIKDPNQNWAGIGMLYKKTR